MNIKQNCFNCTSFQLMKKIVGISRMRKTKEVTARNKIVDHAIFCQKDKRLFNTNECILDVFGNDMNIR